MCASFEASLGPAVRGATVLATWSAPCLGLCDRAPAALVEAAGAVAVEQLAPIACRHDAARSDERYRRTVHAARRRLGSAPARARRESRSREPRCLSRARRISSRCTKPSSSGRRASSPRSPRRICWGAAAPRFRPAARWKRSRGATGDAALPRLQRRRVRAGHVQRPRADGAAIRSRIVEAMTIAAYAHRLRARLHLRARRVSAGGTNASSTQSHARARPACSATTCWGAAFASTIEVRRGAGAYICGEETALFNSIEGKRGEPRNKPPFPVKSGLFGKPTQINNVETLANLLPIVLEGGAAYARIGTAGSTGTRLFCLSGAIARPGVYEVAARHDAACADRDSPAASRPGRQRFQAILLGGAAGTFVDARRLDDAADVRRRARRRRDARLGRGDALRRARRHGDAILRRIAEFFREESCGQCVPCRVGTVRQEEALERRPAARRRRASDLALLDDIGRAMRDASICGLGQTAASAIESSARAEKLCPYGNPSCTDRRPRPDGMPVEGSGATILDACERASDRNADALLSRVAHAGQRLPRLRRRARRLARAGAGLRAPRRGRA